MNPLGRGRRPRRPRAGTWDVLVDDDTTARRPPAVRPRRRCTLDVRRLPPRRTAGVLLQLLDREPGASERRRDLTEAPEALDLLLAGRRPRQLEVRPAAVDVQLLVEVVLAPAQALVDAHRDGMLLVQEKV